MSFSTSLNLYVSVDKGSSDLSRIDYCYIKNSTALNCSDYEELKNLLLEVKNA